MTGQFIVHGRSNDVLGMPLLVRSCETVIAANSLASVEDVRDVLYIETIYVLQVVACYQSADLKVSTKHLFGGMMLPFVESLAFDAHHERPLIPVRVKGIGALSRDPEIIDLALMRKRMKHA
jgi:hypothetical protein